MKKIYLLLTFISILLLSGCFVDRDIEQMENIDNNLSGDENILVDDDDDGLEIEILKTGKTIVNSSGLMIIVETGFDNTSIIYSGVLSIDIPINIDNWIFSKPYNSHGNSYVLSIPKDNSDIGEYSMIIKIITNLDEEFNSSMACEKPEGNQNKKTKKEVIVDGASGNIYNRWFTILNLDDEGYSIGKTDTKQTNICFQIKDTFFDLRFFNDFLDPYILINNIKIF